MITKRQRKILHALEKMDKVSARGYQRWLSLEDKRLCSHPKRWRKIAKMYGYRGKSYYVYYLWEGCE